MSNTTSPTTVPANTAQPTGVPPSNPFAGLVGGSSTQAPATGNASWYGLTNPDLNTELGEGFGMVTGNGPPTATTYDLDPFGLGVPIKADASGGYTVGAMVEYITNLTPDQISQVQAELAGAGYYGPMNSLTSEPQWGQLGQADFTALGRFGKDLIVGKQNGSTPSSVLARATAQWNTSQQNQSSLTPVKDLGKNYTITNLDPNSARQMVDQTSLKVLGHTLDDGNSTRLGSWLNDNFTARQRATDQGDIQQNATNAQATAQASDFIDPVTGRALDHNGVTSAARSQLGVQYQWGAQQAGKAFDCSGLTQWVYGQNGIQIPRLSQQQWADPKAQHYDGISGMSQAQPGDLVFFGGSWPNAGPTHVGIYIGNGMMIDAPHTGSSVRIDNVSSFASSDSLVGFTHYQQVNNTQIASTNLPPGIDTGSPSAQVVTKVAQQIAAQEGVDPNKLTKMALATMQQESGGNASAVGDNGTSFGLFQLHQGGELGNLSQQQAFDPTTNATTAITVMAQQLKANPDASLGTVAAMAQRPADPAGYAASVDAIAGGGSATLASDGATTGTGTDANGGRSILSTPNTFTNVTDESQAALQSDLEAQLRSENPAQAQAHDMTSAYTMLAKSLRDGITINNT